MIHNIKQFFREHSIGASLKGAVQLTLPPQLSILNCLNLKKKFLVKISTYDMLVINHYRLCIANCETNPRK